MSASNISNPSDATRDIQIIIQPNVLSPKKISLISTIAAVALGAIIAAIVFESVGGLGAAFFTMGCTLGLIDTVICIHSCLRLRHFYHAVKNHQLEFPNARFEEHERAFDYQPFVVGGRTYFVTYIKDRNLSSAMFFLNGGSHQQHFNALGKSHTYLPPSTNR